MMTEIPSLLPNLWVFVIACFSLFSVPPRLTCAIDHVSTSTSYSATFLSLVVRIYDRMKKAKLRHEENKFCDFMISHGLGPVRSF
jgi:hypothetical protein